MQENVDLKSKGGFDDTSSWIIPLFTGGKAILGTEGLTCNVHQKQAFCKVSKYAAGTHTTIILK